MSEKTEVEKIIEEMQAAQKKLSKLAIKCKGAANAARLLNGVIGSLKMK